MPSDYLSAADPRKRNMKPANPYAPGLPLRLPLLAVLALMVTRDVDIAIAADRHVKPSLVKRRIAQLDARRRDASDQSEARVLPSDSPALSAPISSADRREAVCDDATWIDDQFWFGVASNNDPAVSFALRSLTEAAASGAVAAYLDETPLRPGVWLKRECGFGDDGVAGLVSKHPPITRDAGLLNFERDHVLQLCGLLPPSAVPSDEDPKPAPDKPTHAVVSAPGDSRDHAAGDGEHMPRYTPKLLKVWVMTRLLEHKDAEDNGEHPVWPSEENLLAAAKNHFRRSVTRAALRRAVQEAGVPEGLRTRGRGDRPKRRNPAK